jgi:formate dehydrogenase maturation protein FdhE
MTAPAREDYCPACGSKELLPFAVIVGAAEIYGYQCLSCSVTWPVIQTGTLPDARALSRALKGLAV